MPATKDSTARSRFAGERDPEAARVKRVLLRRYGDLVWDGVVRGSGVLALVGIAVVQLAPPSVVGLVGFLVVTIWVNGPIGVFLPATYEPILMLFGRLYPPVLIGVVGIAGTLYVEFLNYHLYRRILESSLFRSMRDTVVVRRIVPLFRRAPFFTVWLCAWSPLPYWAVRVLGPLAEYPVPRYLLATFLGRFPRLWFFAALGAVPIPTRWLVGITLSAIAVALLAFLGRPALSVIRRAFGGARMEGGSESLEEVAGGI
jgi:uncharacterized membrane protein YdjX (TVP38/TMEM64 family)